jgi:hypothetical protein
MFKVRLSAVGYAGAAEGRLSLHWLTREPETGTSRAEVA